MQLFYSPYITPNALCTLDAEESRHAVRVLRLRQGEELHVTDGRGSLYHCRILEADDRACVVESIDSEGPLAKADAARLHLAVAPTKNPSRMEWLVEKAVEVGVDELTLLNCDHSERTFLKTERLQKIAPAVSLREWLHSPLPTPHSPLKLIAHCEADKPRTPLADVLKPGADAIVLIGPEGDFSEEEITLALQLGFQPVSLGPSRLRTETAALYTVAAFNLINDSTL